MLPFTASDDNRPILQCVNFVAKEGKLTLVSADDFRLAVVTFDYDDGEGQALIIRDDLKGVANALKRSKRVRVSFEPSGSLDGKNLIIDTELVRYKLTGVNGNYPDWQKLVPTEFNCQANFDTVEAIKAVNSLKVLSDNPKDYPIDLTIGNGKIVMANPDDKGQAELVAEAEPAKATTEATEPVTEPEAKTWLRRSSQLPKVTCRMQKQAMKMSVTNGQLSKVIMLCSMLPERLSTPRATAKRATTAWL